MNAIDVLEAGSINSRHPEDEPFGSSEGSRLLQEAARKIRIHIIKMIMAAGSGHVGGSLGVTDILTAIYFGDQFNLRPEEQENPKRDRFVLSNGHVCPALYAVLAEAGYFPPEELVTLRQLGSRLQGHPTHVIPNEVRNLGHENGNGLGEVGAYRAPQNLPGIEATSGSLGQGLSVAAGMAIGVRMPTNPRHSEEMPNGISEESRLSTNIPRIICMVGDGELQEGSIWEALMLAAHKKLDNLTLLVDRNNLQTTGSTEQVVRLEPLHDKLTAFGWHTLEVDGHNFTQLNHAFSQAKTPGGKPTAIICHTIMGKGVSFMENNARYHSTLPTPEEAEKALAELTEARV